MVKGIQTGVPLFFLEFTKNSKRQTDNIAEKCKSESRLFYFTISIFLFKEGLGDAFNFICDIQSLYFTHMPIPGELE